MRLLPAGLVIGVILFASDDPMLDPSAIVSAADHRGGRVSPGEIVVLYPGNVGPEVMLGAQLDDHGRMATTLAETRVWFDDVAAPLAYTVRGEVGAVVPYEVAGRASTNIVVEYRSRRSAPVAIAVAASNPSLFTENRLGTGQAGILNDTGCCNSQANPAVRGSEATVYSTGEGLLRGRVATGSISAYKKPSDYPRPRLPVRLSVGGVPAELVFVAAAPHSVAGVLQINFRVPLNAPTGDAIPLVLTVGNASSSSVATMAVRAMRDQILVAASSTRSLERFRAVLAGGGYEVHTARNTAEALVVARKYPVDLVILDQQGSDFDISEMRAARPRLKLIVAVDNLGPEALRLADMLDAQAVVPRPVLSQLLLSRVRELIRRRTPVYDAGDPWPFPGRPLKPSL